MQEIKINEIDPSDVKQCKYCKSYNITSKWNRWDSKRLVCNDCWKSWSVPQYLYNSAIKWWLTSQNYPIQKSQPIAPIDDNARIDQIIREIQYKKDKNLPLIIYYKDDTASTRTFHDYYVFRKYLKVKWKDHYYTYLLKDIREIL